MRTLIQSPFITFFLILGLYLFLTVPALFTTQHFLFNLEPYPDSLYYLVPSTSLIEKGTFGLVHQSSNIRVTLPPLYSIVLIPLLFITSLPVAFYVTNLLLASFTLFGVWSTLWLLTRNRMWAGVGGVLVVGHSYFIWLAAVPMAENLSLAVFSGLMWITAYLATKLKPVSGKEAFVCGVLITALPWTKFSLIIVAVLMALLIGGMILHQRQLRSLAAFGLALALGAALFLLYQIGWLGFDPLEVFRPQFETKSNTSITAFSLDYISRNASFYVQTLAGGTSKFLWQIVALSSGFVSALSVVGAGMNFRNKKARWVVVVSLFQIGGLLLIQLPFYVADARYLIASLPALVVLATLGLRSLAQSQLGRKGFWLAFGIVLISLVATQHQLYRQLIANNLFQRSQAWQYESIQVFNAYFAAYPSATLITVLPPYLIDIYQNSSYDILPLSSTQEFMNARQRPWGELPYNDLSSAYRERLSRDENLFVTNAYLSSQHEFNSDWHQLSEEFSLELVHEGCYGTCNIYKLGQKTDVE